MLERTLLIWLLGSSAAAYWWPSVQKAIPGVGDPFAGTNVQALSVLIAVTMFAIGLMLPKDEVRQVLRRWPTVLGGTFIQYAAMPAIALAMAMLWRLEGDYFVGIVMVGCVPGAMASNVLTLNARGNTSYSVSLTTAATLASPIAVPLALALTLRNEGSVDSRILIKTSGMLLATVVLPVISGHLMSLRFPSMEKLGRRFGSVAANLAILWIIAVVVGRSRSQLASYRLDVVWALLCLNLCGYSAGFFGGTALRLPHPMRRALTLEVGMQNAGLGATLASQLFPDQKAIAIAPAMYTFGCMFTGTMLARLWAMRTERLDQQTQADEQESTDEPS